MSQTGTLLIGPGGRPKTSQGKNGPITNQPENQIANQTNSRISNYSANAQNQTLQKLNQNQGNYGIQKNATNTLRANHKINTNQQLNNYQGANHQRSVSTQENYPGYAPELMKQSMNAQNGNNLRRSLDNYTQIGNYSNQRPIQMNYQNPPNNSSQNFNNQMFGNGAANNSFNKLPKYGNAQNAVKSSDSN